MSSNPDKIIVVKLGGATLGSHDTILEDVVDLQQQGKSLIIVHGGGKLVTEWLKKQGVQHATVEIHIKNLAAQNLSHKVGFNDYTIKLTKNL